VRAEDEGMQAKPVGDRRVRGSLPGVRQQAVKRRYAAGMRDRVWRALSGVGLFIRLAILLLVTCMIGGVIPQDDSARMVFSRLGPKAAGFAALLGLDRVFRQWWFIALLSLLAVNLASCSIRSRRSLRPGAWFSHVGMLVILAGAVLTGALGTRGVMPLNEEEAVSSYMSGDSEGSLPFKVRLKKFTIEYYGGARHVLRMGAPDSGPGIVLEPGREAAIKPGMTMTLLGAFPDVVMSGKGPVNRSGIPRNPAIRVEVDGDGVKSRIWIFQNFPLLYRYNSGAANLPDLYYTYEAPQIRQFVSRLEIVEDGRTVARPAVSVNSPFAWKGWRLFQSGYDEERRDVSIIQVSRDPGTPVVYAGFLVLSLGLAWSFIKGG